jgi:integrase
MLKTDFEHKLLHNALTGRPLEKLQPPLIASIFIRYLNHCEATNSKTTYEAEYYHLKTVREFFARKGIKTIDQLDAGIVQEFQVDSLQQYSPRTFNNQLGILKSVLNKAVEWGVIEKNPIRKVKKIKIPVKYHYFAPDEIKLQLKHASPYVKRIIGLGAYAGLRRSEMAELKMSDIDFKRKEIKIRSDQDYTPKGKRPRTIPLSDGLIKILETTRCLKGAWVLPRKIEDGSPFNFHRLQELSLAYKRLLRKLNQKGKLHDLRHSFGTFGIASGVPIRDIQAWMGHSDIQSTMIYAHHVPDANRTKINLLPY